jgi:hypothetical protein
MNALQLGRGLAVLAILGTLALLLYPLAYGPYSTTHGPVTVLRAMRDSLVLRLSIVLAALSLSGIRRHEFFQGIHFKLVPTDDLLAQDHPLQKSSVLRC